MKVDEMGVDEVGVDEMGSRRSGMIPTVQRYIIIDKLTSYKLNRFYKSLFKEN